MGEKLEKDTAEMSSKILEGSKQKLSGKAQEVLEYLERTKQEALKLHPDNVNYASLINSLYDYTKGYVEETLALHVELEEKNQEIARLKDQLAKIPLGVMIEVPKYDDLLKSLVQIGEEKLPALLGRGRPPSDVKVVFDDVERKLTFYLFGIFGIEKRDTLDKGDKEIYKNMDNLSILIQSRLSEGRLAEGDIKLIGDFSEELALYAKNELEKRKPGLTQYS